MKILSSNPLIAKNYVELIKQKTKLCCCVLGNMNTVSNFLDKRAKKLYKEYEWNVFGDLFPLQGGITDNGCAYKMELLKKNTNKQEPNQLLYPSIFLKNAFEIKGIFKNIKNSFFQIQRATLATIL